MAGPPPKPASQRRRQNKTTGRRTLSAAPLKRRVPALGSHKPPWLKSTREWWARIWRSPMAAAWIESDVDVLRRLAELVDDAKRGPKTAMLLGEIRALEREFGLTPLARRRLEWEIEHGHDAELEAEAKKSEPAEDGRWLRAVK